MIQKCTSPEAEYEFVTVQHDTGTSSQLPNLCTGIRTIECHRSAGRHPLATTHFGARLGAFFYSTGYFENNVLFKNTAQIYLVNLHWKLGLGFKLKLRVALF